MQWKLSDLNKKVKDYNKVYFNDEIKLPIKVEWSTVLFKDKYSDIGAVCANHKTNHIIRLNVMYTTASEEIIRCILVHEMVHAWQGEYDPNMYDDWEKYAGHGPSFIKKCKELNSKFDFKYPLQRYLHDDELSLAHKLNTGLYYVYKDSSYTEDDGSTVNFPFGVFLKHLYDVEIRMIKRNGLNIKYYDNAVFSSSVKYFNFANTAIAESDFLLTYSAIKNLTPYTFTSTLCDKGYKNYLFTDDDFNFTDGKNV